MFILTSPMWQKQNYTNVSFHTLTAISCNEMAKKRMLSKTTVHESEKASTRASLARGCQIEVLQLISPSALLQFLSSKSSEEQKKKSGQKGTFCSHAPALSCQTERCQVCPFSHTIYCISPLNAHTVSDLSRSWLPVSGMKCPSCQREWGLLRWRIPTDCV